MEYWISEKRRDEIKGTTSIQSYIARNHIDVIEINTEPRNCFQFAGTEASSKCNVKFGFHVHSDWSPKINANIQLMWNKAEIFKRNKGIHRGLKKVDNTEFFETMHNIFGNKFVDFVDKGRSKDSIRYKKNGKWASVNCTPFATGLIGVNNNYYILKL